MLLAEGAMEIRILHRQGLSAREIARRTGHSRNTVERYLRSEEEPRYSPRPPVAGKLGSVSARAKADGASCTTSSAYAASRTASAAVARRR